MNSVIIKQLSDEERQAVQSLFGQHPVYAACYAAFNPRSAHLENVNFEAEDVFCAVAALLDELFQVSEPTQLYVDSLWTELYKDIRKSKSDATAHDKQQVAHTVFAIVRKLMCHKAELRYSDTLFDMLGCTIQKETDDADKREFQLFQERLREFSGDLDAWVNHEYGGRLSDEIQEEMSKVIPKEQKGKATNVLDLRLDENKVVTAIRELKRHELGEINFAYAIHSFFESIGWLADKMDTKFVAWMKYHKIFTRMAKDLKQANPEDSRVAEMIESLHTTFQEKHPKTGKWRDRKEYFKPNKKLINSGE